MAEVVRTARVGTKLYQVNFHGEQRWVSVPGRGPVCDRCQNETEPQAGQFRCARCGLDYCPCGGRIVPDDLGGLCPQCDASEGETP
jgi:hypothetical protein